MREPVSSPDGCGATHTPTRGFGLAGRARDAAERTAAPVKLARVLPAGLARLGYRPGAAAGPAARLPQIVTLVLAALLAAEAALLAWRFVPGARRPPPLPAARPPAAADVSELLHARLFGVPAEAAASGANAPASRVALVLTGTLAVRDPRQGLAIIGESAQNARVHVVGALLPGGVRLREVYADRVVIERGGSLETLALPRQLAGAGRIGQAPRTTPAPGAEPPLAESVQRLIAQGPEVVGEMLRPMPTYVNGQLKGFRVYPGRDRRKFTRLGLQPGDLVTQINGVPLSDAQRGMEVLRSLGAAGSAAVTVERGGSAQQISIDAAQIAAATAPEPDSPSPPPVERAPPDPNDT